MHPCNSALAESSSGRCVLHGTFIGCFVLFKDDDMSLWMFQWRSGALARAQTIYIQCKININSQKWRKSFFVRSRKNSNNHILFVLFSKVTDTFNYDLPFRSSHPRQYTRNVPFCWVRSPLCFWEQQRPQSHMLKRLEINYWQDTQTAVQTFTILYLYCTRHLFTLISTSESAFKLNTVCSPSLGQKEVIFTETAIRRAFHHQITRFTRL